MARWLLVDGYNLVKVLGAVADDRADALERDRHGLLRRLRGLPDSPGDRITVVFDGRGGLGRGAAERWGAVEARFATGEGGADAFIVALLEAERDRSRVTVVTSDREVASAARGLGARVISSQDFAASLDARRDSRRGSATGPDAKKHRARHGRGTGPAAGSGAEKPPPPDAADIARWEREFTRRDDESDSGTGDRRR